MEILTFIIPTLGRPTLNNSLNSLINQSFENWFAIVIFDGLKSTILNTDNRIKIIESEKLGTNINNAGNVRNLGISLAKTKWIAFLDDDDIIEKDYIKTFYYELKLFPLVDVLIFRMKRKDRIIPALLTNNFYKCDVGISFIMKKEIYDKGIQFIASPIEDFILLDKIRNANYKMIISPFITYFVKEKEMECSNKNIGNRVLINYNISSILNLLGYLYYYKSINKLK